MSKETKEFVIYVKVAVCCICEKPPATSDAEIVAGDLICKPCMVVVDKMAPTIKILDERIKKNGTSFEVEIKKLAEEVKADDPNVPFRVCNGCSLPLPRAEITTVAGRLLCKGCNKP